MVVEHQEAIGVRVSHLHHSYNKRKETERVTLLLQLSAQTQTYGHIIKYKTMLAEVTPPHYTLHVVFVVQPSSHKVQNTTLAVLVYVLRVQRENYS